MANRFPRAHYLNICIDYSARPSTWYILFTKGPGTAGLATGRTGRADAATPRAAHGPAPPGLATSGDIP